MTNKPSKNSVKSGEAFYTAEELARELKVNIMTIYRYIKRKKLRAYKIGKQFRIDKKEFGIFLRHASTK
jgi:excisionase family DNA binding protein